MSLGRAELGRQEHLVPVPLHGLAQRQLRARLRVVGGGVEVVDAALDGLARHPPNSPRAQRDVRDPEASATEQPIILNPGPLPLGPRAVGGKRYLGLHARRGHRQPAEIATERRTGAGRQTAQRSRPSGQEATTPELCAATLRRTGRSRDAPRPDHGQCNGRHRHHADDHQGELRHPTGIDPLDGVGEIPPCPHVTDGHAQEPDRHHDPTRHPTLPVPGILLFRICHLAPLPRMSTRGQPVYQRKRPPP